MSIFPFIDVDEIEEDVLEELPVFREYAYDFDNNCLLLDSNGNTYLVEKDEALKIWIYKALRTVRYLYSAHSDDYGNECDSLIGKETDTDIRESEITRYIIETVMVNPYFDEILNFVFLHEGTKTKCCFTIVTVYGGEIQEEWSDEDYGF